VSELTTTGAAVCAETLIGACASKNPITGAPSPLAPVQIAMLATESEFKENFASDLMVVGFM
jgi:hypothetical protein